MPLSRRDFCATAAIGLSVGAVACRSSDKTKATGPAVGSFEVPVDVTRSREMALTRSVFAREVNTRFTFSGEASFEARLAEVKDLGPAIRGTFPRGEVFELFFDPAEGGSPSQGTYHVQHARLGQFDMFIVPIGRRYCATFNRI